VSDPARIGWDTPPLTVGALIQLAHRRLSFPPSSEFTRRPQIRGKIVVAFVLSLELARTTNAMRHKGALSMQAHRKKLLDEMRKQMLTWGSRHWGALGDMEFPLPGRPQVNAVRFSSVPTDPSANFAKEAIDCLQPSRMLRHKYVGGLNIIRNDRLEDIEENQWHEMAPRSGPGFVYLEVRS